MTYLNDINRRWKEYAEQLREGSESSDTSQNNTGTEEQREPTLILVVEVREATRKLAKEKAARYKNLPAPSSYSWKQGNGQSTGSDQYAVLGTSDDVQE